MALKIFTPGHGQFMDSLIMYGLVSSLPSDADYHVSGVGGSFEIEIRDKSLQEFAAKIANDIRETAESIVKYLVDDLRLIQRGSREKLESYLSSYSNPGVVAENIERAYGSPGHARYEGRGRRGQHLWLPFYPHIGKYFTGEYEYSPVNYGVCPTCITLAALGFYRAAVPIRFMPPRNALNAVLFSFEGEVSGETLANILSLIRSDEFNGLISRIRSKVENIPLSTLIYVLITCFTGSVLRRIYESKAMWAALSITFDIVKGQVVQIRGYEEFSIDRYISSLVYLLQVDEKHNIGPLDRLIGITRRLMEKDEAAAVEALYRFLNTRSHMDLYLAIRRIVKVLGEGPGKVFCEELACLTQMI